MELTESRSEEEPQRYAAAGEIRLGRFLEWTVGCELWHTQAIFSFNQISAVVGTSTIQHTAVESCIHKSLYWFPLFSSSLCNSFFTFSHSCFLFALLPCCHRSPDLLLHLCKRSTCFIIFALEFCSLLIHYDKDTTTLRNIWDATSTNCFGWFKKCKQREQERAIATCS